MRIGIDLMGSDHSPCQLFAAVQSAIELHPSPSLHLVLFLTQEALDAILAAPLFSHVCRSPQLEFQIVPEVIHMHEEPVSAFREKKNSSMATGLKLLKKKYLDALVTMGNSGALIAGATLTLPLLPEIKRPALLACLPTEKGHVAVLDVGGNVSCRASHLIQFAQLGAAYQRTFAQITRPRVGVLNIGIESKKGPSAIRQAYDYLLSSHDTQTDWEFIGNVEGSDIFLGIVDVLITDGFTGNVLLKTSEGISRFILKKLKHSFSDLPPHELKSFVSQFDEEENAGALVVGIERIVIKCHGRSSAKGLFSGIKKAIRLVQHCC